MRSSVVCMRGHDVLDVTPDQIAELSDEDLRALVGLLCEAELRRRGHSASAVTWGGEQNAPDGGLDVRVDLPEGTVIEGFVPRPATGFQVKRTDMSHSRILHEMSPKGHVRASVRDLADRSGAYVIVSSRGSVADGPLTDRRNAMCEAVSKLPNANNLTLEFFDRGRLATWVREHPGMVIWVRDRVGASIRGWRPYGNWSNPSDAEEACYIADDSVRLETLANKGGQGLTVTNGIGRIRERLSKPGSSVRLVGLSGVGKTRLVQALFDDRINDCALDPSLALYTDMADDPDPQPIAFASDVRSSGLRAILVVDNCSPELHRQLSSVCRSRESLLSVLTIEYDIRDDQPEETDVFLLLPSSNDVLVELLGRSFPDMSSVDVQTIADFSGGNFRIAIALASTVRKNDAIGSLNNEELFKRLFAQRYTEDNSLMYAAQACSLVYSFQGDDVTDENDELPRLAALVEQSPAEIFGHVATLYKRGLVQRRGRWRAVLPHAISNRLASMALERVPRSKVEAELINGAPARLLRSFSRRLGYLHNSAPAVDIVQNWLSDGGLLADVGKLNNVGESAFKNVAPASPEFALCALERAFDVGKSQSEAPDLGRFVLLVRSIAYDPSLFDRCIDLLAKLHTVELTNGGRVDVENVLKSLFYIYLSGTQASTSQRHQAIGRLLLSTDKSQQDLGLAALDAALEASHFSSSYSFDFGARSRSFGNRPASTREVEDWFRSALKLVEFHVSTETRVADRIRSIFADQFRGLWTKARMCGELDRITRAIHSSSSDWKSGWLAIQKTIKYDADKGPADQSARLVALGELLRPRDLLQKIRYAVVDTGGSYIDPEVLGEDARETATSSLARSVAVAEALGEKCAGDSETLRVLLPELVAASGRTYAFGRGLAKKSKDPREVWTLIVTELETTPEVERNVDILCGFVDGLYQVNQDLAVCLLDVSLQHDLLSRYFPLLQAGGPIDDLALDRLIRSLESGVAPPSMFERLAWGRSLDQLPGLDLKRLVTLLAAKPEGYEPALEIVAMRLFADSQDKREHDASVIETGRLLLRDFDFSRNNSDDDYKIGRIVSQCLSGLGGGSVAQAILKNLIDAESINKVYFFHYPHVISSLFGAQPIPVLDTLFSGSDDDQERGLRLIREVSDLHTNPLDEIRDEELLDWCSQDPDLRCPTIAASATIFEEKRHGVSWTPISLQLLEQSTDRVAVLTELVARFRPMSWGGSLATILRERIELLRHFDTHPDHRVRDFVNEERPRLLELIDEASRWELEHDKERDESFE